MVLPLNNNHGVILVGKVLAIAFLAMSFGVMSGCASVSSEIAPGASLAGIETVYVQKLPADERGIERVIADQMNLLGYKSSYGESEQPPGPVDAVLTYQDKWMWDITMYMLRLDIQVRDAADGSVMASGQSYRPSMQRRSPEVMAREVLEEIFNNAEQTGAEPSAATP